MRAGVRTARDSGVPEGIACGKAAKDSMTRQRAAERIGAVISKRSRSPMLAALLSTIATCTPFVILLLSS